VRIETAIAGLTMVGMLLGTNLPSSDEPTRVDDLPVHPCHEDEVAVVSEGGLLCIAWDDLTTTEPTDHTYRVAYWSDGYRIDCYAGREGCTDVR
jgi:hypothetical protein